MVHHDTKLTTYRKPKMVKSQTVYKIVHFMITLIVSFWLLRRWKIVKANFPT